MSGIPGFYKVVNALIAEIAEERGQDLEEFRESLLAKIKDGMDSPAKSVHARTHANRQKR